MQVDLLAFGAHPDDVELGCGGTLLNYIAQGNSVAIVDLTQGELGTRGTLAIRKQESINAAKILGITDRKNLTFKDALFKEDEQHQLKIIEIIRYYKPKIVLTPAIYDRHPDHGKANRLITNACFYAGLKNIKSSFEGNEQEAWRPNVVYHYIQAINMKEDFVIDISNVMDKKMEAILAYKSQFYDANSKEPATYISNPEFLDFVKARAVDMGHRIQVKYGEGFVKSRSIGLSDIGNLI